MTAGTICTRLVTVSFEKKQGRITQLDQAFQQGARVTGQVLGVAKLELHRQHQRMRRRDEGDDEGYLQRRHVFRESNKAADTHANWLMDNGDSNPGAQWKRRDYSEKLKLAKHVVLSFGGARRGSGNGAAAWILWIRNKNGEF